MKMMMKRSAQRRRDSGYALIVSVVLLLVMTLMAVSALDIVGRDQQVAGYDSRKSMSLYAAEAGLAEVMRSLEATGTPDLVPTDYGDSSLYPHGHPHYELDPTTTDPIEDLGTMGIEGQTANIGGSSYQLHVYRVRVQGTAPGAVATRIETALGVFSANTAQ
jgi:hypothetical protein